MYNKIFKENKSFLPLDINDFLEIYDIEYKQLLKKFSVWKFPKKIYRAIAVKNIKDINWGNIGMYFTHEIKSAKPFWKKNGQTFILVSLIQDKQIDWKKTMILNLLVREQEIRLFKKEKIKIIGIINPENNKLIKIEKTAIS